MGATFYHKYTLDDIFNNKELQDKMPFLNYTIKEREDGTLRKSYRTKNIQQVVFGLATPVAKPFFTKYHHKRTGNTLVLEGIPIDTLDAPQQAVYDELVAHREFIREYANVVPIIKEAHKLENKLKRQGQNPKLYLRIKDINEIKNMSAKELGGLMENIIENLVYSNEYGLIGVTSQKNRLTDHEMQSWYTLLQKWQRKVGYNEHDTDND